MLETVDKPRQRFLPQALRGILFSGSLVVTDLCGWIRDDCSDRFYQVKRLLNHLVSPEGDLTKRLFAWTSRFRRQRPFLYYRLLDGLQEFVRLYPVSLTKIPPGPS